MTPARPKVSPKPGKGMTPKKSLATEKAMIKKKDAAAGKKPGMGPNVVNKLTAGSSSKMDKKAMVDKMTRKGSRVSPKPPLAGLGTAGPKRTPERDKAFMERIKAGTQDLASIPPTGPVPASSVMMKKGGMCKTKKYARGGGIEVRGKTKGKMI